MVRTFQRWQPLPGQELVPWLRLGPRGSRSAITSRFYTTCFTGVVVPYVCKTGSSVCGK
jgi:hypothetical protein